MKAIAAALLCAGLALTAPVLGRTSATVTRFHTGADLRGAAVALQPENQGQAGSLEFASTADQLGAALAKLGFQPASTTLPAVLLGDVSFVQTVVPLPASARGPRFSIGIGGGFGGGGVGVNVGTNVPIGSSGAATGKTSTLSLTLRQNTPARTTVWEGRVTTAALTDKQAASDVLLPKLIAALLADFPGPSGKTITINLDAKKK